MKKDKHLTLRLSFELYDKYVQKAIKRSQKEGKLIKLSTIIREVLEDNK